MESSTATNNNDNGGSKSPLQSQQAALQVQSLPQLQQQLPQAQQPQAGEFAAFGYSPTAPSSSPPTPRGKVKPRTKRKQVKSACLNCRKRKTGCDEERPCTKCVRNGLEATCVDIPRKKRTSSRKRNQPGPSGQPMYIRWEGFDAGGGDPSAANGQPRDVPGTAPSAWKGPDTTNLGYPPGIYPRGAGVMDPKQKKEKSPTHGRGSAITPGGAPLVHGRGGVFDPSRMGRAETIALGTEGRGITNMQRTAFMAAMPSRGLMAGEPRLREGGKRGQAPSSPYGETPPKRSKLDEKNGSSYRSLGQQMLHVMYEHLLTARHVGQGKLAYRKARPIQIIPNYHSSLHGDTVRRLLHLDHPLPHPEWRMPKQLSKPLTDMFKDTSYWPKGDELDYWFVEVSEAAFSRSIAFWTQVMHFELRLASMPSHSPKSAWLELYTKWLTECVTTLDPTAASPSQGKLLVVQEDVLFFNTIPDLAAEDIRNFEEAVDQGTRQYVQVDRCCGYSPAVLQQGGDSGGEYHVVSYGGSNVRMPYLLISVEPNTTYVRHIQQLQGAGGDVSGLGAGGGSVGPLPGPLPPSAKAAMMGAAIVLEWRLQALLEQRPPTAEQLANPAEMWDVLLARQVDAFCVPIFIIDGPRVELWLMEYARPTLETVSASPLPVQHHDSAESLHPLHLHKDELEGKKPGESPHTDPDAAVSGADAEATMKPSPHPHLGQHAAEGHHHIGHEDDEGDDDGQGHVSKEGESEGTAAGAGVSEVGEGDAGGDTEVEEGERVIEECVWENSRYAMHYLDGFDLSADRADASRTDLLRLALVATNLLHLAEHCKHFQPKAPLVQSFTQQSFYPSSASSSLSTPLHVEKGYPTLPPSASMLPFAVGAESKMLGTHQDISLPHGPDESAGLGVPVEDKGTEDDEGIVGKDDMQTVDVEAEMAIHMDIDSKAGDVIDEEDMGEDKVEEEGKMV